LALGKLQWKSELWLVSAGYDRKQIIFKHKKDKNNENTNLIGSDCNRCFSCFSRASIRYISPKSHKGYVVRSVTDGHKATIAYTEKGKWVYTIQQYILNDPDKNNIERVRSVYYDYTVTGIQKVEQPGMGAAYVVHLENLKSVKLVRSTNDEMEQYGILLRDNLHS